MARETQALSLTFPLLGVEQTFAFHEQSPRTTVDLRNVRGFDIGATDRARGSQRPGLTKYVSAAHTASTRIQDINHLVTMQTGSPSSAALNVRTFVRLAVAGGTVKKFTSAGFTSLTSGSTALSADAPVIFSAQAFGDLFYADGVNTKFYDTSADDIATWSPSAGSLPTSGGKFCRLIELWNGRVVLSGLAGDPHNWFMSAQDDPFDWQYLPSTRTTQNATAGNNAPAGEIGDVIMSLVPINDDVLAFGGDHTIHVLRGNPLDGGRIDLVTDVTGMAWGRPWAKDANNTVYFVGSRGGFYRWRGDMQPPERISDKRVDHLFRSINMNTTLVRCAYSELERGIYVFLTDISGSTATDINFFYDLRLEAFFIDQFDAGDHQPVAVHLFDGDDPDDRVLILGSEDGRLRYIDQDALNDDGTAINSWVFLGPLEVDNGTRPFIVQQLQAYIGIGSHDVQAELYMAESHEQIFRPGHLLLEEGGILLAEDGSPLLLEQGDGTWTGSFSPGRNKSRYPRRRGYVGWLKLYNDTLEERWSLERVTAVLKIPQGSRRRIF